MTIRRIGYAGVAALWLGASASLAQNVAAKVVTPCVSSTEAASLMLVLAPEAIKAVGVTCTQALPRTALLRQTSGPFMAKYVTAADSAWGQAKQAFSRISGPQIAGLIDSDAVRPLMAYLLAPMIAKEVKPADCAQFERMANLLAALPPRNIAELIVTILQMKDRGKAPGDRKSGLPICPVEPR